MRRLWKIAVTSLVLTGSLFGAEENQDAVPRENVMVELHSKNYDTVVKGSPYVIVDVYSKRCGACKQLEPVYERMNRDYGDKYVFAKLNASQNAGLSNSLRIKAYPTLIFYKNGKEVGREIGYMTDDQLLKKTRSILGTS